MIVLVVRNEAKDITAHAFERDVRDMIAHCVEYDMREVADAISKLGQPKPGKYDLPDNCVLLVP